MRRFPIEPETSVALGYGFRCGFLGLLHMEIIQQRLEREFDLDLVTTAPSVVYQRRSRPTAREMTIDNPTNLPPVQEIDWMEEPFVDASGHYAAGLYRRNHGAVPG